MQDKYIEELFQKIQDIEIWLKNENKCMDYSAGIQLLLARFTEHKKNGSQVFFIGNGGSSAIASHMTADFMKNGGMKTYSLYDNAVTTCMGNDYGYEFIFSQPLKRLAEEGDLLVAVSSSGNSPNIVNAIQTAIDKKMQVITLSGFENNNHIIHMGNYNIHVPVKHYGIVESIHNLILQQIVDTLLEFDGECS